MVKIQTIEKLFYLIVVYSYLLLPAIFLFNFSKKKEIILLALYGILFFGLLNIYEHLPNRNLRILYICVYTFLEYAVFAYLIGSSIKHKILQKIILLLSFCFLAFQIVYYLTSDFKRLDSVPIGIETILMFIYIAFYFYNYFKIGTDRYIYHVPTFWIAIGILIYLGGTFFFNILINHVDQQQYKTFWHLTYVPEILKNVLFSVSIFIFAKQPLQKVGDKVKNIPYLDMI